jgi:uncharacterized protein YdiU (UPF0061 family)
MSSTAIDPSVLPFAAIPFDNSYARLPAHFYARIAPTPVASPSLIQLNTALATSLGLDPELLATPQGIEVLAGNRIAHGSEPIALAYAGHQFGHFVPQLGDGRANLLGEVVAPNGLRYDLQLKGSGPTPFSRRGDGRAALGPVLREYLVSEAMFALGVPTTRALAAVLTGEPVYRESPLPGAILTRVASSHLRVGTFQYFAARGDNAAIRTLADYAISRHYPDLAHSERPYTALLHAVIARHASLVAQWMLLGFLHGVMNTDNTSISGETIDYGPCAFLEAYEPAKVFSSIDQQGRYAYRNQPFAASWNLARLAETLLPLLQQEQGTEQAALDTANTAIATFEPLYEAARLAGLRRKLGLTTTDAADSALAEDLLTRMAANRADFTLTFARLTAAAADPAADATVRTLFADPTAYDTWVPRWRTRQPDPHTMRPANPLVIPRNHLVEEAIQAAEAHDLHPFHTLLSAITRPHNPHPRYTTPATPNEEIPQTFCGT